MKPTYAILSTRCHGCLACVTRCPARAIAPNAPGFAPEVNSSLCVGCGVCAQICSAGAAVPAS